jgi:thiosulfate/3-mercaptopyruvate sulfurtransferase
MSNLVSTAWLAEHLKDAPLSIRVVDASWTMPDEKRAPAKEFEAAHIPGAVFFDIDGIADHSTDLPHMMPTPGEFSRAVGALGIGDGQTVVVYDGTGLFSAPRAWWMLKAMGHRDVKVLDGGLLKWKREGRAIETGPAKPANKFFTAIPAPAIMRDFEAVMDTVKNKSAQLVDARSASRFTGEEAEPRAGVRGGHMPGARNVPWRSVVAPDGTLKPPQELRAAFAGVDLNQPIVTTCGSGISAAILMLALTEIGAGDVALYDGSWTEWGGRPEAPVVTGQG